MREEEGLFFMILIGDGVLRYGEGCPKEDFKEIFSCLITSNGVVTTWVMMVQFIHMFSTLRSDK